MIECQAPEEWVDTQLSSIATVASGVGFPKRFQGKLNGTYPVYKVGDISNAVLKNNGQLLTAGHYVNEDEAGLLKGKVFDSGVTLFAKIGEAVKLNRRAIVRKPGLADNNVMAVIPETKELSKYIHFFMKTVDLTGISRSTTVPSVRKGDIEGLKILLPPLAEQKVIADKLDSLLAQVEATKARLDRVPDILKRFRQSVLAAAVSGRLTEEWRSRKNTDLQSWKLTNVGELAEVGTGKTPKRTNDDYWENGTVPWLTSASTGKPFTYNAEQFVTDVAVKECSLKLFPEGTLILAMYGEGKTRGQVTELKISAACNQACATIMVDTEKLSRNFMKIRLMENYEETRKVAAGGTQPNLNLKKVRNIPVNLPPKSEQTEIVRRVEELFAYADKIEQQVQAATERVDKLTQSILAKAFRGELTKDWRAANPDLISGENSAEALLEKIRLEREALKLKKKAHTKKVTKVT